MSGRGGPSTGPRGRATAVRARRSPYEAPVAGLPADVVDRRRGTPAGRVATRPARPQRPPAPRAAGRRAPATARDRSPSQQQPGEQQHAPATPPSTGRGSGPSAGRGRATAQAARSSAATARRGERLVEQPHEPVGDRLARGPVRQPADEQVVALDVGGDVGPPQRVGEEAQLLRRRARRSPATSAAGRRPPRRRRPRGRAAGSRRPGGPGSAAPPRRTTRSARCPSNRRPEVAEDLRRPRPPARRRPTPATPRSASPSAIRHSGVLTRKTVCSIRAGPLDQPALLAAVLGVVARVGLVRDQVRQLAAAGAAGRR